MAVVFKALPRTTAYVALKDAPRLVAGRREGRLVSGRADVLARFSPNTPYLWCRRRRRTPYFCLGVRLPVAAGVNSQGAAPQAARRASVIRGSVGAAVQAAHANGIFLASQAGQHPPDSASQMGAPDSVDQTSASHNRFLRTTAQVGPEIAAFGVASAPMATGKHSFAKQVSPCSSISWARRATCRLTIGVRTVRPSPRADIYALGRHSSMSC